MTELYRAMISSTTKDMLAHRQQAQDACIRQDFFPVMMEQLPPSPDEAVRRSLSLVDQADVYVLVLGLRYGEIPPGYAKSYTHLELDRAVERRIPVLVMLTSKQHSFTEADVDLGPEADRVLRLREEVQRHGVSYFSGPEDLRSQLIDGLSDLRQRLAPRGPAAQHLDRSDQPPNPLVVGPYTLLQTTDVVGRQRELDVLTDWVSDPATEVHRARLLVLLAIGGMGKSAVTWKWFNDIAPQELPALAGRVWWSFYESDARFDNFVLRTLGYVTGRAVEELRRLPAPEREEELLDILGREAYLVVLDGVERLLLAYSRSDASRLADDELDEQTAHRVAGALGLPPSAATSFTGQSRLRVTVDPRTGVFLRRLARLRASRVLITSRLFPVDLQTVTTEPVPGAHAYFLGGLTDTDAVTLWRALGNTGSRAELIELFATFDNYPLLIRALAGEVARFRPAPRDFAAWRAANPGFEPFSLPLVQRKAHVLEYALGGLTEQELRVLHTVAAFRSPTTFPTLVALLVGDDRPCAGQADLDRVLTDLEDRGLLGWDRGSNRYDLHPVVRGVAWSSLDPDARYGIDLRLASHLGEAPEVDEDSVTCIDDLANPIELYHTLVRLGRLQDAVSLLEDRILEALAQLGGYRFLAELVRVVTEDPDWLRKMADTDGPNSAAFVCIVMGLGYQFAGDPVRALDSYDLVPRECQEKELVAAKLFLQSIALDQRGCLVEAERCARSLLASLDVDDGLVGEAMAALGSVLLHRGLSQEGGAWFDDYRVEIDDDLFGYIAPYERGWAAVRRGDPETARVFARRLDSLASAGRRDTYLSVCARLLRGAIMSQSGEHDEAGDLLNGALVDARQAGLGELEVIGLTQLAEWHLRGRRLSEAQAHASDAVELAERAQLRLRWADALNVLSRVERAAGRTEAAAQAACAAYLQAWCDGPPFSYMTGLEAARGNLSAVGAAEPDGLDGVELGEPLPDVLIGPVPAQIALASLRKGQSIPPARIVTAITRLDVAELDPNVAAELDAIFGSDLPAEIRAAALQTLTRVETDDERRRARIRRAVRDESPGVRVVAATLLDCQADPGAAAILHAFAEHDPEATVREASLPLLAAQGSDEAFTVLGRIAEQDANPRIREHALNALVRIPEAVAWTRPALLHAVRADPSAPLRRAAAELITGLEPGVHDVLLRQCAVEDGDSLVRERLLILLAGARGTWLWNWWNRPYPEPSEGPRKAATLELGAGVRSFLHERSSSDAEVEVRTLARLLLAAAHPEQPPGVLLLDELAAAPAADRESLCVALCMAGGPGRDPAALATMVRLLDSEESNLVRLELARWLQDAGHPHAELVLRELRCDLDPETRCKALAVSARHLDEPDRLLLSEDLDGIDPFLDPLEPITATRMAQVAERLGKPVDEARRDYERLAAAFGLVLE